MNEIEMVRLNVMRAVLNTHLALKTLGTYDRHLWAATLALYRTGDAGPFIDTFLTETQTQITRAWNAGAREMGVQPDEFSFDDQAHLQNIIGNEHDYILRLAGDISNARGLTMDQFRGQFRNRIGLWVNRYREAQNNARLWFGQKAKFEWVLGPTEKHCTSCSSLNGIIAFGYEWDSYGFHTQEPPNPLLSCGGWNCKCDLKPTTKRRTIRARDRLTEIALLGAGGL